jgi:hypothetical protein
MSVSESRSFWPQPQGQVGVSVVTIFVVTRVCRWTTVDSLCAFCVVLKLVRCCLHNVRHLESAESGVCIYRRDKASPYKGSSVHSIRSSRTPLRRSNVWRSAATTSREKYQLETLLFWLNSTISNICNHTVLRLTGTFTERLSLKNSSDHT